MGFNLLTDPWIPVEDGVVSIMDALAEAHRIDGWPCGDPAFSEALIRLLVPMVYRITGMDDPGLSRDDFASRQRTLLDSGELDRASVVAYLSQIQDRFWLLNPPAGNAPFAQDPTLAAAKPKPPAKAVTTWASGNNPMLGPHAPCDELPPPIAAQQLLVQRCYSAGGMHTKHPAHRDQGAYRGAPLRGTTCVHPVGTNFAVTLLGHLVPLPHNTRFGQPFWESDSVGSSVAPYTQRSGLLEQIAVRQDKTMLFRASASDQVNGFTIAEGRGVDRRLFCQDPYWLAAHDDTPIKPRQGRAIWRECEALLTQSHDGEQGGSAGILDWAVAHNGSNYRSDEFSWAAISHRGDRAKDLAWGCSHAPHLLSIFSQGTAERCREFLAASDEAEKLMTKQMAKVWHMTGLMPAKAKSRPAVYAPAKAQFWHLAESDFWATAQSETSPQERDDRLRAHALAGYDQATARLLNNSRTLSSVVESRRWMQLWRRPSSTPAEEMAAA